MMLDLNAKILVAEDTDVTRKSIRAILTKLGFANVVDVADGEAAWHEILKASRAGQPFRLVMSDWGMPGLDGLELFAKLRDDKQVRGTPFLLLTGNTEKNQILKAAQAGISMYLAKPFSPALLEEKLKGIAELQLKAAA